MMSQPCANLGEEYSRQRKQQVCRTQNKREHLKNNGTVWLEQNEQKENYTKFGQRVCYVRHEE